MKVLDQQKGAPNNQHETIANKMEQTLVTSSCVSMRIGSWCPVPTDHCDVPPAANVGYFTNSQAAP